MNIWIWLYKEGYSPEDFASFFNVSPSTVRKYLKENNVNPPSRNKLSQIIFYKRKIREAILGEKIKINQPECNKRTLTAEQEKEIVLLYLSTGNPGIDNLSKFFKRSYSTIYNVLKKYGVRPKNQKLHPGVIKKQKAENLKKRIILQLRDEEKYSFGIIAELFGTYENNITRTYNQLKSEKWEFDNSNIKKIIEPGEYNSKYEKLYPDWKKLYDEDRKTISEISKKYGISASTISAALRKMGVEMRGREHIRFNKHKKHYEEWKRLHQEEGVPICDLSKRYKVNAGVIRNALINIMSIEITAKKRKLGYRERVAEWDNFSDEKKKMYNKKEFTRKGVFKEKKGKGGRKKRK